MHFRLLVALPLGIALLGGCGAQSSTDSAERPSSDTQTHAEEPASALPAWYRANYPDYADAEPTKIRYNQTRTPNLLQFAYSVGKMDADVAAATFKRLYSANGWTVATEQGEHRFTAEKAGGYSVVVGITETRWVTVVSITAHGPESAS